MSEVAMYIEKENPGFKAIQFTDDMPGTLRNIQKFMLVDSLRMSYEKLGEPKIILSNGRPLVSIGDYIYRSIYTGEICMMDSKSFNELYELRG